MHPQTSHQSAWTSSCSQQQTLYSQQPHHCCFHRLRHNRVTLSVTAPLEPQLSPCNRLPNHAVTTATTGITAAISAATDAVTAAIYATTVAVTAGISAVTTSFTIILIIAVSQTLSPFSTDKVPKKSSFPIVLYIKR